jgi:hypothetical protein
MNNPDSPNPLQCDLHHRHRDRACRTQQICSASPSPQRQRPIPSGRCLRMVACFRTRKTRSNFLVDRKRTTWHIPSQVENHSSYFRFPLATLTVVGLRVMGAMKRTAYTYLLRASRDTNTRGPWLSWTVSFSRHVTCSEYRNTDHRRD